MRRIIPFLIALCLALPAAAERKQSFGDLDVHYSVFNSSFIQPDIASAAGPAMPLVLKASASPIPSWPDGVCSLPGTRRPAS